MIRFSWKISVIPILVLAIAICFWPIFWRDGSLFPQPEIVYDSPYFGHQNDELEELLPWRTLTHHSLRRGEFPLWNPYAGLGMPLAANNQSGAFAVSTWISLWIEDPVHAFSFGYLAILFLASLSVYSFLRIYDCHSLPALLGATLFLFQGSLWWDFSNYQPRSWAAIALFFLAMGLKRHQLFLPAAFLSIGFMFLSTNLQVAGYGLITLWIYLLVEILSHPENRMRLFKVSVFGTFMAILIAAIQIMATLELLRESTHTFSSREILTGTLGLYGQLHLLGTYLGPMGVGLCILGKPWCSRVPLTFLILATLVPVLSMGITLHPSLNVDNNYYLMPFILVTPILFGWGCESLWMRKDRVFWLGGVVLIFALKIAVLNWYLYHPSISLSQASASPEQIRDQLPRFSVVETDIPPRLVRFRTQDDIDRSSPKLTDEYVRQEFPPNLPILNGFADVQIYDSFIPKRLTEWFSRIEPRVAFRHPLDLRILCFQRISSLENTLFSQISPKWLLTRKSRLPLPGWKLTYKMLPRTCLGNPKPLYLYRNMKVLSRAFLTYPEGSSVEISRYSANEIRLQVSAEKETDLILREMHFPGWLAFVDGEPVTISPENDMFRRISVKKGEHTVIFRYRPGWLFPGILLFCLGWLGSIILFWWCRKIGTPGSVQPRS